MTAEAVTYPYDWHKETDGADETYTLYWHVNTTDALDGPDVAWTAAGLPVPGASLSVGNTINPWAFYQRKGTAKLAKVEASRKLWNLTTVFSTKPSRTCVENGPTDPLLQPHRVRGSFTQVMEEAIVDQAGDVIQNSSEQRYTGPEVQRPVSYPVIDLEMNVLWINLAWLADIADSVNNNVWWGQPIRTIKCTVGPWERMVYGECYTYFTASFRFELNSATWDLKIPDEGTRVTDGAGGWKNLDAREMPLGRVLLDGAGAAMAAGGTPTINTFRKLKERDFSTVGWPAVLI